MMTPLEISKILTRKLHELMAKDPEEKCDAITKECDEIRDQSDGPWYAMTAEEQEQLRQFSQDLQENKMAVKGRWGYHPCTYEVYLQLKYLKKKYWETVYAAARYNRWERKFPHNRKGPEPPKYCPFIGNRVWAWQKDDLGNSHWKFIASKEDQLLLDLFEEARMPKEESEVKVFHESRLRTIGEIYEKVLLYCPV